MSHGIRSQASHPIPSTNPANYRTLAGLLRAVERALYWKHRGARRIAGIIPAQYLQNAEYAARENFGDTTSVPALMEKWSVTRREDLLGGDSLFGIPLPKRAYEPGDNVPGVGRIDEVVTSNAGTQYRIDGQWFHERCFAPRR